jgi:acetyltransferase EpsM
MDLVILGAGGHAKDLLYLSQNDKYNKWNVIGYLDDRITGSEILGPIKNLVALQEKYRNLHYTIAVNSSVVRRKIDLELGKLENAANLIHESAIIGSNCRYKDGLTMGPYSVLTIEVSLGRHVHINSGATINQSSSLGDYCTVSPGARICGDVRVGDTTAIGAGSIIINVKSVGSDCILGAGTVVIDNIDSGSTVVGVPGRPIKRFGEYI